MKGDSLQGTILILDGVSTNRIMLKVQLSAAWYHVVQADRLDGLAVLARRTRPDLIVTAMALPDGSAIDVRNALIGDETLAAIPIIAITPQNDRRARLRALGAGIDEVLAHPLDDVLLQARIRSLIRTSSMTDDLHPQDDNLRASGLAESAAEFAPFTKPAIPALTANVALVTRNATTGAVWRARLKGAVPHQLSIYQMDNVQALMDHPVPDSIVVELSDDGAGLRFLADLRARSATRHAAIIAVPSPANTHLAAEALDRGAHDVLRGGFCADELALRLESQLLRKARSDQQRDDVRDGLRAAVLDPMTGLFNRRYAMPKLSRIARHAVENGRSFAVMLVDLDHFKQVNDRYGHLSGDAVLIETARRLRAALRPTDIIARIGGEEFMIVLPDTNQQAAKSTADRLCRQINATPFVVPATSQPVSVTTSIGVVVSSPSNRSVAHQTRTVEDHITTALISRADQALYKAKGAGRNQFTMMRTAA
jgi:two-component system cell cycle response regulator